MAMSTADYFRMMQGGVDRTGYADMMPDRIQKRESIEDRLAKLMAQSDDQSDDDENVIPGALSESEALSINMDALKEDPDYDDLADVPEYLKVQPAVGTGSGLLEGLPVDARGDYAGNDPTITRSGAKKFLTSDNLIEAVFGFPQFMIMDALKLAAAPMTQGEIEDFYTGNESTGVQDLLYSGHGFAKHKDTYNLQEGDTNIHGNKVLMDSPLYDAGSPYHDLFKADGGRVGLNVGGQTQRGGLRGGRRGFGGPPDGGPDNNKNNFMGPSLDVPTIDPMKAVAYTPVKQPSLIDQVKKYNFLQGVYGDEDDGLSFGYDINPYAEEASAKLSYSFADGGRVGLQSGGLPPLPPLPGYTQPTFGYDTIFPGEGIPEYNISIGGPDGPRVIPGPGGGPGMSPPPVNIPEAQAYNPYVSTMPLYDPSTLGTGLPSTVGATDPYMMYDPYAPVGAFSKPPSNTETPFGLTEDQIKEGFSDMDRFSLAAQQAKRKAAEEEAAKNKPKGGGGGGGGKN